MSSNIVWGFFSALLLAAPYLFPGTYPLAWIAVVPLFWLIGKARSFRGAVFYGWAMGFLAHVFGFYWLVYTISVFGGFGYALSSVIFVVYALLQGLRIAIFAALVWVCGLGPLGLFPPLFWVALEFWFPSLFPWYLANSQSSFISFIQSADLVGPYGASLILMWFNTVGYEALRSWREGSQVRWRAATLVVLFVAVSIFYGVSRLGRVDADLAAARELRVAAVQGNIDVDLKWNPTKVKENLESYRALTKRAEGVPLVVWPETAIEEWVPEKIPELPREVMPPLSSRDFYFIFGARSFRGQLMGPGFKAFNSAFLTDGQGRVLGVYHKQVLLAFGEYLPFAAILSKLPAMPFAEGFTPGDGPYSLDLPGGVRIAPLICYEDLMPELSRAFVSQRKVNLLVNLTNDAWYGRTVAPWQHARLAQWRAIETRRSLLRVTNTGVTTMINAKGEIQESLPIFTPGVLQTNVKLLEGETFYVWFGDWLAWSVTVAALAILAVQLYRRFSSRS